MKLWRLGTAMLIAATLFGCQLENAQEVQNEKDVASLAKTVHIEYIAGDTAESVRSGIVVLPPYANVKWTTDHPEILAITRESTVVTPSPDADVTATITANIKIGSASDKKSFLLTIAQGAISPTSENLPGTWQRTITMSGTVTKATVTFAADGTFLEKDVITGTETTYTDYKGTYTVSSNSIGMSPLQLRTASTPFTDDSSSWVDVPDSARFALWVDRSGFTEIVGGRLVVGLYIGGSSYHQVAGVDGGLSVANWNAGARGSVAFSSGGEYTAPIGGAQRTGTATWNADGTVTLTSSTTSSTSYYKLLSVPTDRSFLSFLYLGAVPIDQAGYTKLP